MRKVSSYKCPICKMEYKTFGGWSEHMHRHHPDEIPKGFTDLQYFYYTITGKKSGACVQCHKPTDWNEATGKYNRYCNNPKCKEQYCKVAKKRMIDKYGKIHLLNDPEMQRKMLSNRKIAGSYTFSDGSGKVPYVASYEKDFLMTMDTVLGFKATDIMSPSPHNYVYMYEGKPHFYIPDFYIPSLNLEIEIKDDQNGPNANKHPKIAAVDRVKEALKDETMAKNKSVNYFKVMDKSYTDFFKYVLELKECIDDDLKNTIVSAMAIESVNDPENSFEMALERAIEYDDDEEFNGVGDYGFELVAESSDLTKAEQEIGKLLSPMESDVLGKLKSIVNKCVSDNSIDPARIQVETSLKAFKPEGHNHIQGPYWVLLCFTDYKDEKEIPENHKFIKGVYSEYSKIFNTFKFDDSIKASLKMYSDKRGDYFGINVNYKGAEPATEATNQSSYYRVTYNGEGVYNALKHNVPMNTWKSLLSSKAMAWLPKPPTYGDNCRSYFTKQGYAKFMNDTYPSIVDYLDKDIIKTEEIEIISDPVYQDKYQIVVNESALESVNKSKIDNDFVAKGHKSLSSFKCTKLTHELRKKYEAESKMLKHAWENDATHDARIWLDGDKMVAHVCVFTARKKDPKYDGYKWISSLEVSPEYRGYGLGKQLLDFAVDTMGGTALGVYKDNEIAIKMYKDKGFKFLDKKSIREKYPNYHNNAAGLMVLGSPVMESVNAQPPVLYHGSNTKVTSITPHVSTHGKPWVYATADHDFALCYSGKQWNDLSINQAYHNGQLTLTEIENGAFDKYFNCPGYIYSFPGDNFREFNRHELVSDKEVVLGDNSVEYVPNVMDAIKKSGIKLYRYPNLPPYIKNREEYIRKKKELFANVSTLESTDAIYDEVDPAIEATSNESLHFETPKELHTWMKNNFSYANFTKLLSPEEMLVSKKGSCHDQALFAYTYLKKMGLKPKLLFFIAYKEGEEVGGMTHTLCFYEQNNKVWWFETAWNGAIGLRSYPTENAMRVDIFRRYMNLPDSKKFPELEFKTISPEKPGVNLAQYVDKALEVALTADERTDFGIPSLKKYPMPDPDHVKAAIRMFNHVDEEHEKELAENIIKYIKKYKMTGINVGKDNRFHKYYSPAEDSVITDVAPQVPYGGAIIQRPTV